MSFHTVCFLHAFIIIVIIIIFDVDLCGRINFGLDLKYTQKKKFSQYLCFLIKSTILDISLINCMHELYYRNFTCIRLSCDN